MLANWLSRCETGGSLERLRYHNQAYQLRMVNVNLSLSTPGRRIGGSELLLQSFLTSKLSGG
jgi:hypothetical protein